MLILTRKVGESILIGDDIVVTIMGQNAGQIRVGVAAPPKVRVDREEIRERINREKEIAALMREPKIGVG